MEKCGCYACAPLEAENKKLKRLLGEALPYVNHWATDSGWRFCQDAKRVKAEIEGTTEEKRPGEFACDKCKGPTTQVYSVKDRKLCPACAVHDLQARVKELEFATKHSVAGRCS